MFERTATLWRRLMSRRPAAHAAGGTTAVLEEDRRVWVRHAADLQTHCEPALGDEPPETARILDISLGGAKLLVNRAHEPGSLISVELPGADGRSALSVLACVVHARAGDDGEWVLGCSFARQLDEHDLRAFGASKTRAAAGDQRNWERYPVNVTASLQVTNSPDVTRWPAKVLNLSAGGVALLVDREVRNGTMLTTDLRGANGHDVPTILACVVHVSVREDGGRVLGCNFIRELSEDDLRALL